MTKRTTIDDVAKLANVHKATVSRALNTLTEHQVSAETAKRVKRAARQLGYVPNVMARGLRTSLSMTIGVIIPDLTNPFFPPIIRGIENYLQPRGYTALLANTDGDDAIEVASFESLLERRVDGFILATGRHGDQSVVAQAYEANVLAVMLNRDAGSIPYPLVTGDDASGIGAAVDHLVELGHRDILHIAGPLNLSTSIVRSDAFTASCGAIRGVRGRVVEAESLSIEAGQKSMNDVLSGGTGPTAVIGGNDLLALGALRSMKSHGLRCPEDVSVIGFNDMIFAEDFAPPLTTVRVPTFDMGAEAARLLLRNIQAGAQEPVRITLPVSLIVRSSTGPARVAQNAQGRGSSVPMGG
jgi:LacI family transcriptional regulator